MRPAVAVLALLAGCATPSEVYERGTATRPAPPALRPGHGAPAVGQPGQGAGEVPRSPNVRVLPPANGPGLWAADEVRAAKRKRPLPEAAPANMPPPRIAEVDLPLPDANSAAFIAIHCAGTMQWLLAVTGQQFNVLDLSPADRQCVAAHLFDYCLAGEERRTQSDRIRMELASAVADLRWFVVRMCRTTEETRDPVRSILERMRREWDTAKDNAARRRK